MTHMVWKFLQLSGEEYVEPLKSTTISFSIGSPAHCDVPLLEPNLLLYYDN